MVVSLSRSATRWQARAHSRLVMWVAGSHMARQLDRGSLVLAGLRPASAFFSATSLWPALPCPLLLAAIAADVATSVPACAWARLDEALSGGASELVSASAPPSIRASDRNRTKTVRMDIP